MKHATHPRVICKVIGGRTLAMVSDHIDDILYWLAQGREDMAGSVAQDAQYILNRATSRIKMRQVAQAKRRSARGQRRPAKAKRRIGL